MDNQITKEMYTKDMLEIKTKLKEHDKDIKEIKEKLEEHSKDIKEIKKKLEEHDKDIKELKEMIKSLQRTMLIIEDAVTNKIPALFDGYAMHQEKQEELENKVEKIEEKVETHSIRITALEAISSNNKNRLSKISS